MCVITDHCILSLYYTYCTLYFCFVSQWQLHVTIFFLQFPSISNSFHPHFHSTLPNGRVESTSWNSVCLIDWLSVCPSSLQHFQYRAFKSSQNHVRPHISYIIGKRRAPWFIQTQERRSQRQRQRKIQRQRQSINRTQHVLYFWKAQGARVLTMTFS